MPAAVSSITRHTVGRTFIVAITILGAFALAQLGAIAWLFCARFHVTPLPANLAKTAPTGSQSGLQSKDFTDPFAEVALPTGTATPATATPPPAPPRPAPLAPGALNHSLTANEPTPEDRINEAIEQGRALRERGDTYAAVTKLREAETYDPKNPAPTAELAMTYEKMGFVERAAECWKRIYDLGEAGGVYYAAAKGKLDAVKSEALRQAQPGPVTIAPSPATGETVGLGPGSKLGFEAVTRTDENDSQTLQKLILHLSIRAKARARIDVLDVAVRVLIYDVVNNRQLDINKSTIHTEWAASSPYWSERDVETLNITYLRSFPQQGEPTEDRKYYGYIASIYYKGALQDFRSDPPRLAQQVPPPRILPDASSP